MKRYDGAILPDTEYCELKLSKRGEAGMSHFTCNQQ